MFQLACSLETDPEMIFLTTFMLGNIFSEYIARYRHISQASLSLTFSYLWCYFIVLSYSAKTQITKSYHRTPYLINNQLHSFILFSQTSNSKIWLFVQWKSSWLLIFSIIITILPSAQQKLQLQRDDCSRNAGRWSGVGSAAGEIWEYLLFQF